MMSGQRVSYTQGGTHDTMGKVQQDSKGVTLSKSPKTSLSSDWSLQFDSMKLELLVIVNQPRRGEYVLRFCTHCPSRSGN